MTTSNKDNTRMPASGAASISSAFSLMEPMLRPGPQASMEVRFGDCSLKLERTESAVRVLLEGASPALPRPRDLDDYLALLASHKDLQQIAVIDPDARRIVTVLDYGAAIARMYPSSNGSSGAWSAVQLVDKLSNQRIAPISFDLVTSAELKRISREANVELPLGEAPKLLAQIEPWAVEHTLDDVPPPQDDSEAKSPAHPKGLRARLVRTLKATVKSALIGNEPTASPDEADKDAAHATATVEAVKSSIVRVSQRPLLTLSESKRFLGAALLVEEARVRLIDEDDPHYAYALKNFEGFPISIALSIPMFLGAPPTTFEATIDAQARPDGTTLVRLVLPPMKDLEEAALLSLRRRIAARTGATVIFGQI